MHPCSYPCELRMARGNCCYRSLKNFETRQHSAREYVFGCRCHDGLLRPWPLFSTVAVEIDTPGLQPDTNHAVPIAISSTNTVMNFVLVWGTESLCVGEAAEDSCAPQNRRGFGVSPTLVACAQGNNSPPCRLQQSLRFLRRRASSMERTEGLRYFTHLLWGQSPFGSAREYPHISRAIPFLVAALPSQFRVSSRRLTLERNSLEYPVTKAIALRVNQDRKRARPVLSKLLRVALSSRVAAHIRACCVTGPQRFTTNRFLRLPHTGKVQECRALSIRHTCSLLTCPMEHSGIGMDVQRLTIQYSIL